MDQKPKRIAKRRRSLSPALQQKTISSPKSKTIPPATTTEQHSSTLIANESMPSEDTLPIASEPTKRPKRVAKRRRTSVSASPIGVEVPSTTTAESSIALIVTPPVEEAKKRKREAEEEAIVMPKEDEDAIENATEDVTSMAITSPSTSPATRKRVAKRRRKLCTEKLPALDEEIDTQIDEEDEIEIKCPDPTLPHHYLELKEFFQGLDLICDYMSKRREIAAFESVKEPVNTMTKRNFSVRHLAQIKTIWPEAYSFQLDKQLHPYTEKQEYRLLIIPQGTTENHTKTITERREHFHKNIVAFFNKAMLEVQLKGEKVKLESFPEIPQAFLPQPNKEIDLKERHLATPMKRQRRQDSPIASPSSIRKKTGAASLKQALLKKRLEEGLKEEKDKDKGKQKEDAKKVEEKNEKEKNLRQEIRKELDSRTSNIAPEVVNKVRRKEEQKMMDEKTGAAEMRKKQDLLNTLPLLCDMVRSFFVSEKKWCLELTSITQKLISAYAQGHGQTVSQEEMIKRLHVVCQIVPTWLEIKEYSKRERYLKLNKNTNFLASKGKVTDAMKNGFDFTLPPAATTQRKK